MSERTDIKPETTEERRDALAEAVWKADAAWYDDIENTALRDAYKAAKATFREFENAAIERGASEKCQRCGGPGGWEGWPGWTCFRCGGSGREAMRQTKFTAAPNTRLKKEAKIDAEIAEKDRAFDAAIAELGDVGEALIAARDTMREFHTNDDTFAEHPGREIAFRDDIATKLWRYGSLSDAQIEAVRKGVDRERVENAAREAAGPLAEGTYEITGEILSTKWQSSRDYGETLKMLVKLDNGNKVWGTVPKALTGHDEKGTRVTFTAEVTRSGDDENFGFFSRPKQARVAEERLV